MLFGQLQSKKKRTALLSVEDLLSELEAIKRRYGEVNGFAVNPLSSVEFSKFLSDLACGTTPAKGVGFVKRNIHFWAACAPGDVKDILEEPLPNDTGMVRICTNPPITISQNEL